MPLRLSPSGRYVEGLTKRVVVIGGGITGLTAAERLVALLPGARVTLLEASERLGGVIQTERRAGRIMERGPDVFLMSKLAALALCRRLGIEDRLQGTNPAARGAYILRRGRLHRVPQGLSGLVPSRLWPFVATSLLSPVGKARALLDLAVPPRRDPGDESVAAFVRRRLGNQMYTRLIEPLLSGIYAGDGERLSILATFPQLRERERVHGSLLRAAWRERRSAMRGPSGFLAPRGGMAEIIEALEARLAPRVDVRRSTRALSVSPANGGVYVRLADGDAVEADAAVVAVPAHAAGGLLAGASRDLARLLAQIGHVSTATISLAYRASDVPRPLDGTGYVVPRAEVRAALACTWSSAKFAGRAPAGEALFRVFFGGAGRPDVLGRSDGELISAARGELRETMGVAGDPLDACVTRWERALPQYDMGHLARVEAVERLVGGLPGVALAGNAYHGVGIPDCVRSAERAAQTVTDYLSGRRLARA